MGKKAIYGCCDDGLKGPEYMKWMKKTLNLKQGENPVVNYIPGGVYDYVNGHPIITEHNQEISCAVLKSKHVSKVGPWNHAECFMYNLFCKKLDTFEMRQKQINDLFEFAKIIEKNIPGIEVIPAFADLIDPANKIFEFNVVYDIA